MGHKLQLNAATTATVYPSFMIDISAFTPEAARKRHSGAVGGPPEVDILSTGEGGVFAARGTLRLAVTALEIFQRLTDPEENARIFARTCAAVNYRDLIEEDTTARTRLFEVSKTGRWSLLGIPLTFESTVYALEDWPALEIRFKLKKPGAMKHMSGYWRAVPSGKEETIVEFYNEAMPSFPLPRPVQSFAGRVVKQMCASLLEDLREASFSWPDRPLKLSEDVSELLA